MLLRGPAVRDVVRHFVERWNFVKSAKSMHREALIPFLIPSSDAADAKGESDESFSETVQVLRHASDWSHGLKQVENSIYEAMIDLVERSEHFVYVENQFFISQTGSDWDSMVRNSFAGALVRRILRAHREKRPYKVIITLPLIPALRRQRVSRLPSAS